jgi:hypothetical protein
MAPATAAGQDMMTQALERVSTCPACSRPVRLTRAELAARRSFCAMCETEFDIAVVDLEGDSAFREQSLVVLARLPIPPAECGRRSTPS